ncbi:hypothetical protein B484DRAFT_445474 [Ochromonadaceae sp. CCMP2298]|nr:hypothetical protein B484DRAFT_445474 [Ochromonadaceae sp. CCMP2298]
MSGAEALALAEDGCDKVRDRVGGGGGVGGVGGVGDGGMLSEAGDPAGEQTSHQVAKQLFSGPPTSPTSPTSDPPAPTWLERAPHLLRSPPPGYQSDFEQVMGALEGRWDCELLSFEAVQKLSQNLLLRRGAAARLRLLQDRERDYHAQSARCRPAKEDLYDIEL